MSGEPLIVDSFAGGGGASTGIEMALGRSPDIAINHSADALAMHEVNHPETLHLSKNIWQVDPMEAVGLREVGLAWFSPDCKHFSKAKGGRPVKRNIRDLAWVVVLWAKRVRPQVIILENVEEFQDWGPLVETDAGRFVPDPARKGETFRLWLRDLKRLGYKVEFRELRACDYGAPTIRKRFFMIARRDGNPIVWPEPTHGPPNDPDVAAGRKLPWRTAAEIIDWSLPCPSIFDTSAEIMEKHGVRAIRPLAEATMKRIARGLVRYVLEARKPFVVPVAHAGDSRVHSVDQPVRTQTAHSRSDHAIVVPTFVGCGGRAGQSAPRGGGDPLGTQTAKADGCVVAPVLVETAHGEISPKGVKRWGTGVKAMDAPIGAGTISGNHALAAVHLSRFTQNGIGQTAAEPLDTVMAGAPKFGVVAAFLAQHNTERGGGVNPGRAATEPLSTITRRGTQQYAVAAHLQNMRGSDRRDAPADGPAPTLTAQGTHAALISGFLTKYYGEGFPNQSADDPLHSVTTRPRHGLVTVEIDGQTFAIADIGMRMLTPRERFRAQGFPDDYVIDRRADGSAITQTVQGSCCGNSVCPPLAAALVRANCGHLALAREAAE